MLDINLTLCYSITTLIYKRVIMALETSKQTAPIFYNIQDFQKAHGFSTEGNWVNSRNDGNKTPLQEAILSIIYANLANHAGALNAGLNILSRLLELGADPALNIPNNRNATDEEKDTYILNAIGFAAFHGAIEACKVIMGQNPECIYAATGINNKYTPFLLLCQRLDNTASNHLEVKRQADCKVILEYLVTQGEYDINSILPDGASAVESCARNGWEKATGFLMKCGANKYIDHHPLILAAMCRQSGVVKQIIDMGYDTQPSILIHLLQPQFPLNKTYKAELAEIILSSTGFNPFITDEQNHNLMYWAVKSNNIEFCTLLAKRMIAQPEILNKANAYGVTYFDQAVLDDNFSLDHFKKLLELNPSILNQVNTKHLRFLGTTELQLKADANSQYVAHNKEFPIPKNLLAVWKPVEGAQGIYNGIPLPAIYKLDSTKTKFIVPIDDTAFTRACKGTELKLAFAKAKYLSEREDLAPFANSTGSTNIHHALVTNDVEIVHNCALREAESINKPNCHGLSPLAFLAPTLIMKEGNIEIAHKIAELVYHGATVTDSVLQEMVKIAAMKRTDFKLVWEDFMRVVDNADEIHAHLHPDNVDTMGSDTQTPVIF